MTAQELRTVKSSPHNHFRCKFPLLRNTRIGPKGWPNTKPNEHSYSHYGIAIQDDEIVLDFDPRNYRHCPITGEILDPWHGYDGQVGLKDILPITYTVITPSEGWHMYYTKPTDIKVSHKQILYPGVDFQGKGRMVVGAGSQIEGLPYQATNSIDELTELPLDFLKSLKAPRIQNPIAADNFEQDDPEAIGKFSAWLGICDPAISGQGGNDLTLKTAYYGRDLGLSSYATFEAMYHHYNPRCKPPWSDTELDFIVNNAYRYAKGAQGSKAPIMLLKTDQLLNEAAPIASEIVKQIHKLRFTHLSESYVLDDKGRLVNNNVTNTRVIIENETSFKDLLWYDEMAHRIRWEGKPWWRLDGNLDMQDDDVTQIHDWISSKAVVGIKQKGYKVGEDMVRSALKNVARKRARNPLTDYLDDLEWDGEKRLDSYLTDTCGAPDDPWSQIAGRKWLIGAVTRAYEPGCQMDYILVLQGDQGIRKSKWIEALGGQWASASHLNPDDKDLYLKLLGTWIMEVPEMNKSLRKHDLDLIKAFITVREDNFRKPYDRMSQRVPRQTVFIGSLNPTGMGFLKDITGDRRYWPILCQDCDPIKLKSIRNQLLAEAVLAYKMGERCELSADEVTHAKAAQESVTEHDPWYPVMYQKLSGQDKVHVLDLYNLLGLSFKEINTTVKLRVYHTLRQLGYKFNRATQDWYKC